MGNARTNSLHEKLTPEKRREIERDLIEQPPGRETYAKCWLYHGLDELGVGLKSLERYGGYLRMLARNQWIAQVADAAIGREVGPELAGLIRSRLFSALVTGDVDVGDLRRAAAAQRDLVGAQIATEQWDAKRRELEHAIAESLREEQDAPGKAAANLREAVQTIYGVEVKT